MRKTFLCALLALAAAAPPAFADSIAFVKDGDVWLASTDGAQQRQITRDGGWTGVAQSDNGVIVAAKSRRMFRLAPSGQVRNEIPTGMGSLNWNGPYDLAVSPDGTRVAFGYLYQRVEVDPDCPFSPSVCGSTHVTSGVLYQNADGSDSDTPIHTGWTYPAWVGNDLLMHSDPPGALDEDVILRGYGTPNNEGDPWFHSDVVPRLHDGEVRGNVYAFVGGAGSDILTVWRTPGPPDPAVVPEGCIAYGQPNGKFEGPSIATDKRALVWSEADGIWRAELPDLSTGCPAEPAPNGRLIIPGGESPDWGGAALPAPGPETPTIGVSPSPLRSALRNGLRVEIAGISGPVALTGSVAGRVVARGKGAAEAPITLRFTKQARRKLAKAKKVKLTVAVSGRPLRKVVTLRTPRRGARAFRAAEPKDKAGLWKVVDVNIAGAG